MRHSEVRESARQSEVRAQHGDKEGVEAVMQRGTAKSERDMETKRGVEAVMQRGRGSDAARQRQ